MDAAAALPGVRELVVTVQVGENRPATTSSFQRAGWVRTTAATAEGAARRAQTAAAAVTITADIGADS